MYYAILMADIKDSGKKESRLVISNFKKLVSSINLLQKENILSPLTITLGDEFQGVTNSIESAVRIIFKIEELIIKKSFDIKLRYVLNYGVIDTKINKKIAYEMLGPGLTEARRHLTELKREESRFLIKVDKNAEIDYFTNKAFLIYQGIVDSWKPKDLQTVSEFLIHGDYKKVAYQIKTDISSAWRRKKSLRINDYLSIKEIILFLIK